MLVKVNCINMLGRQFLLLMAGVGVKYNLVDVTKASGIKLAFSLHVRAPQIFRFAFLQTTNLDCAQ